jgi:hypothetical protein
LRDFRPPGPGTSAIAADFTQRVFWQDPAGVVAAIGRDALKLFALTRVTSPGDTPIARWQFQTTYPTYQHVSLRTVRAAGQRFGGGGPTVSRPLAAFLRAYQLGGGYTPGPLLALAALAGLAGSLGVLRRRRFRGPDPGDDSGPDPGDDRGDPAASAAVRDAQRDLSAACLLCFAVAVTLLLTSDAFEFSWRYQLPALVTLPPAGALGILAIIGGRAGRRRGRTRHEVTAEPAPPALPRPQSR